MHSRLPASRAALTLAKQVPEQNIVFMKKSAMLADPGPNRSRGALWLLSNPDFAAMCYKSEPPGTPLLRCCTSSSPLKLLPLSLPLADAPTPARGRKRPMRASVINIRAQGW